METDYSKFSDQFIQFAFDESTKSLERTIDSFREIINKSYIGVAVYFSVLIYFFEHRDQPWPFLMIALISAACTFWIWPNLMPSKMYEVGTEPEFSMNQFYASIDQNSQLREIQISKIENNERAIKHNYKEIDLRYRRFKYSSLLLLVTCVIAFFLVLAGVR